MFSFIRKRKFYGIYLQYQNANKFNGLDLFQDMLNQITGEAVSVLIVDTSIKSHSHQADSNLILGDNSKREFSGYQSGLEYLIQSGKINDHSVVFIANDTFNVNYAGADFLKFFLHQNTKKEIFKGSLVGYVDRLGEDVEVIGRKGHFWVRTSFFTIGYKNLVKLLPFGKGFETEEIFTNEDGVFFSNSGLISENYRNFLKAWLFKEKNDFQLTESWHSADNLTKSNFDQFKMKAQCIFSEFIFSQDALKQKIKIFDVRSLNN